MIAKATDDLERPLRFRLFIRAHRPNRRQKAILGFLRRHHALDEGIRKSRLSEAMKIPKSDRARRVRLAAPLYPHYLIPPHDRPVFYFDPGAKLAAKL